MMKNKFFFLIIILMINFGCDVRDSPLDENNTIQVTNLTDCDIAVVLDEKVVIYLIGSGSVDSFQEVSDGYHELVAYLYISQSFGEVIDRISIYVSREKDYHWEIRSCS